jgi:transcriptional regulator with XRE-family HTH domain
MQVWERLRIISQFKKASSYYIAEKLGMNQSQVSRMINGDRKINAEELVLIAKIIGVPIEAFFYDNEMLSVLQGKQK